MRIALSAGGGDAPGLNAVTSASSFIVYAMLVRASGARLIETPLREDGFDLDAIL